MMMMTGSNEFFHYEMWNMLFCAGLCKKNKKKPLGGVQQNLVVRWGPCQEIANYILVGIQESFILRGLLGVKGFCWGMRLWEHCWMEFQAVAEEKKVEGFILRALYFLFS